MNNTLLDLILPLAERELDRHCTDEELQAHATKRDNQLPVQQAWVRAHLAGGGELGHPACSMCQSRLRFFEPELSAELRDSAYWRHLGKVLLRSSALEAGVEADGTTFLFGAPAREEPLCLDASLSEQASSASVITLPNNQTIDVKVRVIAREPRLYEVELVSTRNPNILYSISQAPPGSLHEPPTQIDLSAERRLRREELGHSAKVSVPPGVWHLAFWSRVPGEPWTVVELILHDDEATVDQLEVPL